MAIVQVASLAHCNSSLDPPGLCAAVKVGFIASLALKSALGFVEENNEIRKLRLPLKEQISLLNLNVYFLSLFTLLSLINKLNSLV